MYIDIKTSIIWYQKLLLLTSTVLKSESCFLISKKDQILDIKYYFMISEIISFDVKELFFNQIFDFKSVDWNAAKILRHSIYYDIKQIDEMLNW